MGGFYARRVNTTGNERYIIIDFQRSKPDSHPPVLCHVGDLNSRRASSFEPQSHAPMIYSRGTAKLLLIA